MAQHLQQIVGYSVHIISTLLWLYPLYRVRFPIFPSFPLYAWKTWCDDIQLTLPNKAQQQNKRVEGGEQEPQQCLPAAMCSSGALPCAQRLGTPHHTGETSAEGNGTDGWADGNGLWACMQGTEEGVRNFYYLRPYSLLLPAVLQATRCHSNRGKGRGVVFRKLRHKDVFK